MLFTDSFKTASGAWPQVGVPTTAPIKASKAQFPNAHQLALVTPGISPARASSRKQIRHNSNFLK